MACSSRLLLPLVFALSVIRETINITKTEGGYHILLIIADGQVTDMDDTVRAIVEASNYPISVSTMSV